MSKAIKISKDNIFIQDIFAVGHPCMIVSFAVEGDSHGGESRQPLLSLLKPCWRYLISS